ncbi:MAG: CAP domain-containing protein [Prevotellaceae bacterium]|jgi:uncharacterized protein YkwD|nr:CAP domain-containing protein [Prevotellaceae bacterium]
MLRLQIATAILLACTAPAAWAQADAPDHVWPDSLNTARDASYLTDVEREVIHELNKVRSNPPAYARRLKAERSSYDGKLIRRPGAVDILTTEGVRALDECIAALERAQPLPLLHPSECLSQASRLLARDQSSSGKTGHSGSDGSTMTSRIEKYCGKRHTATAENISYGYSQAQAIVYQLLIDDAVASRGHRKNIMNDAYNSCGCATASHSRYGWLCVMDFGFLKI